MSIMHNIYLLNETNIDIISSKIKELLITKKYTGESIVKTCIAAESILLEWMDKGGAGKNVEVEIKKTFGRLHIYIKLKGERIQFTQTNNDYDFFNIIQNNIRAFYYFKYTDETNIADIKLPGANTSDLKQVFIAVIMAVIIGYVSPKIFDDTVLNLFNETYLKPAFSAMIGLLGAFACFQVFFSILVSLLNMGNISVLKKNGGKYLKLLFSTTAITTIIAASLTLLLCPILKNNTSVGNIDVGIVYKLFVDIIPQNILTPFTTGNYLQIVFLAIFLGSIILILGDEISGLNKIIIDIDKIFHYAIMTINKTMPLFVFLSILSLLITANIRIITDSWYMLAVMTILSLAAAAVMLLLAAVTCKIPVSRLIKEALPAFMVGSTAQSTIAALPMIKKALDNLDVNEDNSSFSMNLGLVLSKHTTCIYNLIIISSCYYILGKKMSLGEFIVLTIICMISAMAIPSVPGATIAIITSLMIQYGIPIEISGAIISLQFILIIPPTGCRSAIFVYEGLILDRILKNKE